MFLRSFQMHALHQDAGPVCSPTQALHMMRPCAVNEQGPFNILLHIAAYLTNHENTRVISPLHSEIDLKSRELACSKTRSGAEFDHELASCHLLIAQTAAQL